MSRGRRGGIPRVFVGAPYQRGHGIGSFLGGLFRRVFPYLRKGVRAVGKEALRAGINVIEDVENNTPLKDALKTRFKESRGNLKRKATEKISNLMKGSGYKVSAKIPALQSPFVSHDIRVAPRKRRPKKKSARSTRQKTSKKSARKKKIRATSRKSTATKRRRTKKRSVSDIFS